MSGKKSKNPILHCCVEKDVHDLLMAHCKATGQTKTMAIKRAILMYCKNTVENQDKNDADL